jgi:4-amino-4-deoxy-L-arabinose transferase-like glycosyltransferase
MSHDPGIAAVGATGARNRAPAASGVAWPYSPDTVQDPAQRPLGRKGMAVLIFAILSGLITHGYHLFQYPLYSTDEGIYMERAWSVITEGRLNPYTYIYDHAPGGWLLIAAWDFILPRGFATFGNPVNSGRVLMLLLDAGSIFFLFEITRKLSGGGLLAPTIATFLFNFSPLAIYYQRMVLLDNIMVFWVLLSIYILLRRETRVFAGLWSGLALGVAVLTKENAIFFAPTIFYLLARRVKDRPDRRFAIIFWLFAMGAAVSIYFLFATLKGELLPSGDNFSLSHPPVGHSSLLYEMWYQLHRSQGTLFSPGSYLYTMWLPKDGFLMVGGTVAMVISLYLGWRDRERNLGFLVAGTLAFEIAFYLARGSVILDFYVIPLIPMYALSIALVADRALERLSSPVFRAAIPALSAALLLAPTGGYLLTHGQKGQLQASDVYYLPLTYLQQEQISWIRNNVTPNSKIISDDDIWVALHDGSPSYPYDVSHWNAVGDPNVRNQEFDGGNWQNIDYIVMSEGMRQAMIVNNAGGQENWILNALNNHSVEVWHAGRGAVQLEIYKVQK